VQFHDNRFHLFWTPFLARRGGKTLQAVGLVCPPALGSGGELTLRVAGKTHKALPFDLLRYPTGHVDQDAPAVYLWLVPKPARPVTCRATWKTPDGRVHSDALKLRPAEPVRVHVVSKTHVDLGYTARFEEVLTDYRTTQLDQLLGLLEKTEHNKPGRRFVWTMPTWLLEQCLDEEAVTADRRRRLAKYIRNGQVVFGLMPFTPHSEFFGLEEMCRSLYGARRLAERFGVPVPRAAKLTDVPAHTASMAMAFTAAGGQFLQIGTNPDSQKPPTPQLFWWKLPDESRILCHYKGTYGTTLLPPPEYPYREYLALHVTHDNAGPGDLTVIEQMDWIEQHFDAPAFRTGRLEDFADAFIRTHGAQLPVMEGELTDWWIHGIASQAGPTALARQAKDRLPGVEIIKTLAELASGEASTDRAAMYRLGYKYLSLYTEHTWGDHATDADRAFGKQNRYTADVDALAKKSRSREGASILDRWVQSWRDKTAHANAADGITNALEKDVLRNAAGRLASGRGKTGILLFNVASWRRGGLVRMSDADLPKGDFELIDASTGGIVLYERQGGQIEFLAPPVPAGGYLYLEVRPVRRRTVPGPEADWNSKHLTLHFESYTLQFHTAGGMCRWHDRARSLQWCSNEAEYPMGTFLYEMPGGRRMREFARRVHGNAWEGTAGFFNRHGYGDMKDTGLLGGGTATITPEIGPLRTRVIIEAACRDPKAAGRKSGSPRRYRTTFTVYRGCRDLHVNIELLDKPATFAAEAGYGFFPFYGSEPYVLIDRIAHLVEPSGDFMKGVNTAHLAVHHGIRLELEHAGMNFYPLHTPLVGFGEPGLWRYDDRREYENGILYATLFANGWGTNFAQWQSGNFSFDFVCRPTGNDEWDGGLARGGLEVFRPLVGTVVQGSVNPPARSLVKIEPDLVQLVSMKPADFDSGIVLRLWSADPDPLTAELSLPFARPGDSIEICDLLERPTGKRIRVGKNGITNVPLRPHGITTLLVKSPNKRR